MLIGSIVGLVGAIALFVWYLSRFPHDATSFVQGDYVASRLGISAMVIVVGLLVVGVPLELRFAELRAADRVNRLEAAIAGSKTENEALLRSLKSVAAFSTSGKWEVLAMAKIMTGEPTYLLLSNRVITGLEMTSLHIARNGSNDVGSVIVERKASTPCNEKVGYGSVLVTFHSGTETRVEKYSVHHLNDCSFSLLRPEKFLPRLFESSAVEVSYGMWTTVKFQLDDSPVEQYHNFFGTTESRSQEDSERLMALPQVVVDECYCGCTCAE